MNKEIEKFREGIFSLNTRRFGRIAELMIKELYNYKDPNNNAYDLLTIDNKKIEVKFSTVLKKCRTVITKENAIKQIINSKLDNRMLTFEESNNNKFDCNIQQIKRSEFDILYYGCFFKDKIMICMINKEVIKEGTALLYSNYQHRKNKGEGQFHINNRTLDYHLSNHFVKWLDYESLFDLFQNKE